MNDAAFREGVEAMKAPLAEWESTLLAHHFREMTAQGDPYALDRTIEIALRRRAEVFGPRVLALYAERQGEGVSDAMVRRFLAWPLPASVCADPCASMPNYPHRSGTNLLTYTEAKEMLEYVVAGEQKGQTYAVEEHRGEPRVTLDGTYLKGDRVRVVRVEAERYLDPRVGNPDKEEK